MADSLEIPVLWLLETLKQIGEVLPGEMILHPIGEPDMFEVGDEVICSINQERRNLHAQMHTAQHIVSALAEDIWGTKPLEINYLQTILEWTYYSKINPSLTLKN